MRAFSTLSLTVSAICLHIIVGSFIKIIPLERWKQFKLFTRLVRFSSRLILRCLKVEVVMEGNIPEGNYFIVSNHHSYLDALIISAQTPTAFVTSLEMKATPVLGLLTQLGGCLYVNRRSKEKIHSEINDIEEALKRDFSVVIFPEATSTNGEKIYPFKRPLFQSAIKATKPVLPLVIQYYSIDGEKIGRHNRDLLCWYGDMTFGKHFTKLTSLRKIVVKVKVLPIIPIQAEETKESLAEKSFQKIHEQFQPLI